jgi:uncharacterized HAD superfamily protein
MAIPSDYPEQYCSKVFGPDKHIERILIVDDTISSGNTMRHAVDDIRRHFKGQIDTCAILAITRSKNNVTYNFGVIEHPRVFEWNIAHGKWGKLACDMDGVICQDCPEGLVDQMAPKAYEEWIANAPPQLIPHYTIDHIITCRNSKRRMLTEDWLARHKVRYRNLIMWDEDDPVKRQGLHAEFKSHWIKKMQCEYVFESNQDQSLEIHKITGLPVLSFDSMQLIGGKNW